MIACWKWGGCWSSGSGIRGLNDSLNVRMLFEVKETNGLDYSETTRGAYFNEGELRAANTTGQSRCSPPVVAFHLRH